MYRIELLRIEITELRLKENTLNLEYDFRFMDGDYQGYNELAEKQVEEMVDDFLTILAEAGQGLAFHTARLNIDKVHIVHRESVSAGLLAFLTKLLPYFSQYRNGRIQQRNLTDFAPKEIDFNQLEFSQEGTSPSDALHLLLSRAQNLVQDELYASAVDTLKLLLLKYPNDYTANIMLAKCYLKLSEHRNAAEHCLRMLDMAELVTPEVIVCLSQAYSGISRWDKVEELCAEYLERYPDNIDLLLANIHARYHRDKRFEQQLEKSEELDKEATIAFCKNEWRFRKSDKSTKRKPLSEEEVIQKLNIPKELFMKELRGKYLPFHRSRKGRSEKQFYADEVLTWYDIFSKYDLFSK